MRLSVSLAIKLPSSLAQSLDIRPDGLHLNLRGLRWLRCSICSARHFFTVGT